MTSLTSWFFSSLLTTFTSFTSNTSLISWLPGRDLGFSLNSGMTTPGIRRDPLGDLLLLRDFKLEPLFSLLNMCSALFSLLIIIAPEDADFSLHIASLLLLPGLGDFLLLLFDLPERSKCSDLDLGMAELMQSANRSSSSCPVLSRLSMERSEREELKLLFAFFASNDFGAR